MGIVILIILYTHRVFFYVFDRGYAVLYICITIRITCELSSDLTPRMTFFFSHSKCEKITYTKKELFRIEFGNVRRIVFFNDEKIVELNILS